MDKAAKCVGITGGVLVTLRVKKCVKFSIFRTKRTVQVIEVYKSTGSTILNGHSAGSVNVIKWHWFYATIVNRLNRHEHIMTVSRLKCTKHPALRVLLF